MFESKNKAKVVVDILPAASRGGFEVEKRQEIDLRSKTENGNQIEPSEDKIIEPEKPNGLNSLMSEILNSDLSGDAKQEVETVMSESDETLAELASMGVQVVQLSKMAKPRYKPILNKFKIQSSKFKVNEEELFNEEEFYKNILSKIQEPVSPRVVLASLNYKATSQATAKIQPNLVRSDLISEVRPRQSWQDKENNKARVIAEEIISFYDNRPRTDKRPTFKEVKSQVLDKKEDQKAFFTKKSLNFITFPANSLGKRKTGLWLFFLILFGMLAYGFTLKNEIVRDGIAALDNLESAGESLKRFNFRSAADDFEKSYQNFSQASQNLNLVGAGLAGFFEDLPGLDKLTGGGLGQVGSAKDIVTAGKLIAQSGQAMSQALVFLSQTGSILDPSDQNQTRPLGIINQLKNALALSNINFQKAKALISDIDESIIPEDKKNSFNDFKDKLPLLEEYLGNAVEYTDFLEGIVGIDEPKKYLLLFQNYSELRPAGGFPGTYGVVSFSRGGLADFFVNDVYNLDGQLKKNIIPPRQLQHITPTWGMRDSAWFIDFPISAEKVMSFFQEEAGYGVDGVIAINPDIVSGILEVVGPIKMPEYGLTLTADNFLENIQEEVEYGSNRIQPKKVVADFAPRLLEKLYSADADKWMKIFNVLMAGFGEKDIIFYLKDKDLENFVVIEGFGGEIKKNDGDFLTVNFSNIKGSKTDAVTDSSINIETNFKNGQAIHKVTVVRNHKGGDHEHGFYNRQNPAYVRVLLSEDAELVSISGNDLPNFKPLINYSIEGDFEKDRDLAVFESSFYKSEFPGVDKFEESGLTGQAKKGIGFWMTTDPGVAKKVEFEYAVPVSGNDYNFYFQKQPGLDWKNFSLKLNGLSDYQVVESSSAMNKVGNIYLIDEELRKDFELKLKLKQI